MLPNKDQDQILDALEIRADPFALCSLEGRCSLGLGRDPGATLHYVLEGTGRLITNTNAPVSLTPGRLVLVPASERHSLSHEGTGTGAGELSSCKPAGLNLEEHLAQGVGGGQMLVLCSRISLSLRDTHGLIDLLRTTLSLDTAKSPTAQKAIDALLWEMSHPRTGRRAMIRALLLQCVIELLRNRLEAGDPAVLWVSGLADTGLWQALHAMLDDPGAPHSLESLAAEAGMSRSRFADRFQAAYGRTPMTFLRALRIARAAQLLRTGRDPVKRIAQKVGFSSRSAFSRTFTKEWGLSPNRFRTDRS